MSWIKEYTSSSIGKKQIMAKTGLALSLFLLGHLLGQIPLLTQDADAFNKYAHLLTSNKPVYYTVEVILSLIALTHIVLAIKTKKENKAARPVPYDVNARKGSKGIASFTMVPTGILIALFLILHIMTFRNGAYYETTVDGVVMRDIYKLVVEEFAKPWYSAIYVAAMAVVGFHLRHGVASVFQTFGLNHPKYNDKFDKLALGYALLIGLANAIIVITVMVRG